MSNKEMTIGELLTAIRETRDALKRAEELLEQVSEAGVSKPSSIRLMVEPTLKLKEGFERDLRRLEEVWKSS